MAKVALGNYCPRCGKDVSGDIVRCSNCGTTIVLNRFRSAILTGSGTLAIVGACVFLFAGAFSFFFIYALLSAFSPVSDLFWLGVLSLFSFVLGIIAGLLVLEVVHLKWIFRILVAAIILPNLPWIADAVRFPGRSSFYGIGILAYFVELIFLIFDLPASCLMIAALALTFVSKREFVDK